MPAVERAEIVAALKNVFGVIIWDHDDVSDLISELRPNVFCNGGDRSRPESWNAAETNACQMLGIRQQGGVGGSMKLQTSQKLLEKALAEVLDRNIKEWQGQLLAEKILARDKETR